MSNIEHKELIKNLGGGRKLASKLRVISSEDINEKTVYSWSKQGIPDKWKIAVARYALEESIPFKDSFLPPGLTKETLVAANNSVQIFSKSRVISKFDKSTINSKILIDFYKKMLLIRRFEERVGQLYSMGLIGGFCHLYIGQEAVIVGVEQVIEKKDCVITGYRCHAHMITRGASMRSVFAELLGKASGSSKGKGGSMHMFFPDQNFYGGHGIVGAQVPIGTGIAFANKYLNNQAISVVYFGDGAVNQGQVYEAFNMASLWNLPVLYIIENNQYGMGTSVKRASAVSELFRRGESFGITGYQVDGMDPIAVSSTIRDLTIEIKKKGGPKLVEVMTYRYRGHSMSDPGKYRTRDEIQRTRETRDPIEKIKTKLLDDNLSSEDELKNIDKEIRGKIQEAADSAIEDMEPNSNELFTEVYKKEIL